MPRLEPELPPNVNEHLHHLDASGEGSNNLSGYERADCVQPRPPETRQVRSPPGRDRTGDVVQVVFPSGTSEMCLLIVCGLVRLIQHGRCSTGRDRIGDVVLVVFQSGTSEVSMDHPLISAFPACCMIALVIAPRSEHR